MSTREWSKFFMDAGIPKTDAAQYAAVFNSNRMTFEMLMDLNKEYLKDLEITVLGDVIAILKHAKKEQNKRTTDRVLARPSLADEPKPQKPSSSERRVIKPIEEKIIKPEISSEATFSSSVSTKAATVTARLGPPKAREFNDQNVEKKGGIRDFDYKEFHESSNNDKKPGIFARLGAGGDDADLRKELKNTGILRKRIREPSESSSQPTTSLLKKPSEKTHDKRVSFDGGKKSSGATDPIAPLPRKKYVMVRTLANGEKIKQVMDPNDPLLDRFKNNTTAKKFEPSTKSLSTSSLVPTARPRISSPATSGGHKDIRSRVGAKVIEKTSNMTGGLVADREPQRSVKSRLSSPKYPPMRITSTLSSRSSRSPQEPISRKRITAPTTARDEDESDRKYFAATNTTGSAKSRLGIKQRISY